MAFPIIDSLPFPLSKENSKAVDEYNCEATTFNDRESTYVEAKRKAEDTPTERLPADFQKTLMKLRETKIDLLRDELRINAGFQRLLIALDSDRRTAYQTLSEEHSKAAAEIRDALIKIGYDGTAVPGFAPNITPGMIMTHPKIRALKVKVDALQAPIYNDLRRTFAEHETEIRQELETIRSEALETVAK